MKNRVHNSPNLIYSVGTQVVALKQVQGSNGEAVHPSGAVGVIVRSPSDRQHSYRIRFVDGFEAALHHDNLMLLAEYKQGAINDSDQVLSTHGLFDRVIYRCVVGSRAFGLDTEESDTDRRGIYLPPADLHWSLYGVPEQLENEETQESYWELQKFLVMALKGNPNILECLYTPLVEHVTPLAQELLDMRDAFLSRQVDAHPYALVFATISGAHLYGFPSADSDFDLRGVHLLPLEQVVGLDPGEETVEKEGVHDGLEIDLVTHDAKKFFGLMLKKNGYVLEQLLSPLVVHTTPEHEELKAIAKDCITRHHAHHYLGFAATQWKLFRKESPPKVKPLLYVYRVLLTGIHLMRTGEVEANLLNLNETAKLPYIDELVERKLAGPEKGRLAAADIAFHKREYERLVVELESTAEKTTLPERPIAKEALNDLLVRLRVSQ